jgi:hypothetical protein
MKKQSVIYCILILFILASCTTAHIDNVKMCTDLSGDLCDSDKPVFSQNDPVIYVSCELGNAPEGTEIQFAWYYTTGKRLEIDVVSLTLDNSGSYPVHCSLSAPYDGWTEGYYEVVISVVGFEDKTVTKAFEIK